MWSGGKEENEDGEAILLMQPNLQNRSKNNSNQKFVGSTSPTESCIGGHPCFFDSDVVLQNSSIFSKGILEENKLLQKEQIQCDQCDR